MIVNRFSDCKNRGVIDLRWFSALRSGRAQYSCHQPLAFSMRRARMLSALSGCHQAPAIFTRAWTTWRCALSTSPLAVLQPAARYSA